MFFKAVGVSLIVWLSLLPTPSSGASRVSYGEACNKEVRCDSRNFLSCPTSGVCECIMQDTMIYDETAGKCVTLAGERCLYSKVEGESSWSEELPCISGANCTTATCECLSTHFELSNGTCARKKGHGEDCTSNEMCDSAEDLTCWEGNCTCDASKGLVLEGTRCKILAGNTCSEEKSEKCVAGASCDQSTLTCQCLPEFYKSSTNTCLPKGRRGQTCAKDSQCLDKITGIYPSFLVCREGKCVCDSAFSVDDDADGIRMCRKQLGHLCSDEDCIRGATCTAGICQCYRSNYFQTENQTCEMRRTHGGACRADDQCVSSLTCSQGKCRCPTGTSFSVVSNKCVVSAEVTCKERYHESIKECVPNAVCNRQRGHYNDHLYKCECSPFAYTTSNMRDGLCYAMENQGCNGDTLGPMTSSQCLPGLVCRDSICKCMYDKHQVYRSEKCFSLVGGPCNSTTDCGNVGTECSGESGVKQCQCKQGYVQVGRECQLVYGANCTLGSSNPSCDKAGGLECSNRGICECPGLQEFNLEELSCKGLVGARCDVKKGAKDTFCDAGSICKPFRGFDQVFGLCTCPPGFKTGPERKCTQEKDGNEIIPTTPTIQTTAEAFYQSDG